MTRTVQGTFGLARQRGAALIVALILLLVSTLVAFGAMRGSATQERMTFNQDARTDAYFGAEFGAAAFKQVLDKYLEDNSVWPDAAGQAEIQDRFSANFEPYSRIRNGAVDHGFFLVDAIEWIDSLPPKVELKSTGQRQVAGIAEGEAQIYVELVGADGTTDSPFDGLLACERIHSSSAGRDDGSPRMMAESFNSNEDFLGMDRRGNVRVSTTEIGSRIEIKGQTTYRGSVASGGFVSVGSGSSIQGDVEAFGNVLVNVNHGDDGVPFARGSGGPATINGNVRAGDNIYFGGNRRPQDQSSINGNVEAGALVTQTIPDSSGGSFGGTGNGQVTGNVRAGTDLSAGAPPPSVPSILGTLTDALGDQSLTSPLRIPDNCDPLGIDNIVESVDSAITQRLRTVRVNGPGSSLTLGADGGRLENNGHVGSGGPTGHTKQEDGSFLPEKIQFQGREVSAYSFESIQQNEKGAFRVESGDVLIYVPEAPAGFSEALLFNNFSDAVIEIADGASLTVVTGSRARLGGNSGDASNSPAPGPWENNPLDIQGDSFFVERGGEAVPRFSLFSNANPGFDGTSTAVHLGAGDPSDLTGMHGLIYAPKGTVNIGGSGWVGAVTGREVFLANKSEFLYDEVFGGGTDVNLIASRIEAWREEIGQN